MQIKLGNRERTLLCAMKNIKAIEDNLSHGIVYVARRVAINDLKQSELAKIFSAGLLGSEDFIEPEEVEKLMYNTEGVNALYYANVAVDYFDRLFTIPDKKKAAEASK